MTTWDGFTGIAATRDPTLVPPHLSEHDTYLTATVELALMRGHL